MIDWERKRVKKSGLLVDVSRVSDITGRKGSMSLESAGEKHLGVHELIPKGCRWFLGFMILMTHSDKIFLKKAFLRAYNPFSKIFFLIPPLRPLLDNQSLRLVWRKIALESLFTLEVFRWIQSVWASWCCQISFEIFSSLKLIIQIKWRFYCDFPQLHLLLSNLSQAQTWVFTQPEMQIVQVLAAIERRKSFLQYLSLSLASSNLLQTGFGLSKRFWARIEFHQSYEVLGFSSSWMRTWFKRKILKSFFILFIFWLKLSPPSTLAFSFSDLECQALPDSDSKGSVLKYFSLVAKAIPSLCEFHKLKI